LKQEWVANCVYINPDNIAQETFGDWNAPDAVLKAAQFATQLREDCIQKGESLIFETVFSASDKIDFLERAQKAGYFVRLFFVGTHHPAINASRIAHRVIDGGHDVPISKIISRYTKSISNCCVAATFVDRLYVYDNSENYMPAKLLFRTVQGKILKTYHDVYNWAVPILKKVT
jgi:predicted ABC-type ATPase